MTDNDKIIDKVRKLLRLSESDNVNEAAAAASRAQAMIDQHHIDVALLSLEDPDAPSVPDEEIEHCTDYPCFSVKSRMPAWRWALMWGIASHNHCKPYTKHMWIDLNKNDPAKPPKKEYRRIAYVIGRPSDAAAVQMLFSYVVQQIEHFVEEVWAEEKSKTHVEARTWKRSFREGAVSEVKRRLSRQRKAAQKKLRADAKAKSDGALVKVETALALVGDKGGQVEAWMGYHGLKYGSARSRSTGDARAYGAGRKAGGRVNLGGGKAIGQ